MATPKLPPLPFFTIALLLTFVVSSQGRHRGQIPPSTTPTPPGTGGQKVWCIGKPAADDEHMIRNINYACGEGGMDCTNIQPGGTCRFPDTPVAHASYVMNLFYQKNGRNWWNCHFNETGLVVLTDPSFGACNYPAQ